MVDRLNPMSLTPSSSSPSPRLDHGRTDFGRLLRADSADVRLPPRNAGGSTQASHDNAASPDPAGAYDEKSFDAGSDPTASLILGMASDRASTPSSTGMLADPVPADGLSVLLLQQPYDANPQNGLLIEFGNAIPTIAGDRTALIVSLYSQGPGQRDELVAMPWQLLAGNHLSQMIAGGKRVLLPMGVYRSQGQSPAVQSAAAGLVTAGEPLAATAYERLQGSSSAVQIRMPADSSVDGVDGGTLPSSRLGQSGAFVAWPLRLLRWLAAGNGEITAWLRDYNLSDSAAEAVVHQLRALSDEQGVRLSRIVFNGRELWCATEPKHFS